MFVRIKKLFITLIGCVNCAPSHCARDNTKFWLERLNKSDINTDLRVIKWSVKAGDWIQMVQNMIKYGHHVNTSMNFVYRLNKHQHFKENPVPCS